MYLIVGLGNPEPEYSRTRHNMGFDVINKLADKFNIDVKKQKFSGLYGTGTIENEKVILVKPQTYMNLSGECVKTFADFYKVDNDHILVIYDDIDILTGTIKIRKKGGPGTHNGMKSVVHCMKTDNFIRIRVGIGQPLYKDDIINYVIGPMNKTDKEVLQKGIDKAAEAVLEILKNGIDISMNKFNGKEN